MNKLLTTKTQQLSPIPTISNNIISKTVVVEPEDKSLLLKKGTVYAVYTLKDNRGFDHSLISKVIYDVLSNDYFQTESISPIQSLEKIILGIRDKLTKLSNESISDDTHDIAFDMVAAVLWGNVMYITKYGNGRAVLMRNSELKELETLAEGGFSVTSGIIKDDDVVILCTEKFYENYPPTKLMTAPVGEKDLLAEEACILIKMKLDTSLSTTEQVDFGLGVGKNKNIKAVFTNQIKDKLLKLAEKRKKTKTEVVETLAAPNARLTLNLPKQIKQDTPLNIHISRRPKPKFKIAYVIPLIIIALGASITMSFRKSQQKILEAVDNTQVPEQTAPTQEEKKPEPEVDTEAFYDLKIAEATSSPQEIVAVGNNIVVADNSAGKLYISDATTPKFTISQSTYTKVGLLGVLDNNLIAVTNLGLKLYDKDIKETATYTGAEAITTADYYLDFIYSIEGSKIIKYTISEANEKLNSTDWGTSADFEGAKDLTVAYSIWLITKDNKVVKYTGGDKDSFTLQSDHIPENPVAITTSIDFDNLYIADKAKNKVLVFDKEGSFSKEYANDKWSDIKSITVTQDEKTLYILSGSRVYKISL